MNNINTVFQSLRPPFLLLALVCTFLGFSLAKMNGETISTWHLVLAALGATLAHASVNAFNEYFDYKSGLDATTERTPFSGGSGGLVENPQALNWVLVTAVSFLLVCFAIGVYFWQHTTGLIVPMGIIGALIILLYTSVLNKYPWLCWLSPGLGFGSLITLGVLVVLGGSLNSFVIACSMLPFLLANNLLLLNQFPDTEADRNVGRNTLPLAKGKPFCIHLIGITFIICILLVLFTFVYYQLHILALGAIFPLLGGVNIYRKLFDAHNDRETLIPLMGMNVGITLSTPILFSVGVLFSV